MANVARVEATITAQNKLRPGLSSAARDLDKFRAAQTKATQAFARTAGQFKGMDRMERVAGAMRSGAAALAGGYALQRSIQALKEATVRFAEVDRAMTRTGITGDATAEEVTKGTQALRDLARATGTLFDPAQKGLDAITASGRDFGDAMKMMPSVLKTAQASGAGVDDIANSSTALIDHMKISIEGLAEAQDTLAMGGKLGKFELKDMARYLPSMLPAFKALGQTGQDGLRKLVAMLQVIRAGTGTAEEAASSAQNIFAKMESEETAKKFQKMGVDLRAEMTKARKEGKNLLDVFLELSNKALKGDLSKLPQLFTDMEVQRGMRPLLAGLQKVVELENKLKGAKGTIDIDFKRVNADTQAALDRLKEGADRAKTAIGGLAAEIGSPLIKMGADNFDAMAQSLERAAKAARDGGIGSAVKSLLEDAAAAENGPIKQGERLRNSALDGLGISEKGADDITLKKLSDRVGMANLKIRDPREKANMQDELTRLSERMKGMPAGAARDRVMAKRDDILKRLTGEGESVDLTPQEEGAFARDLLRRGGSAAEPLTQASPEFADAIEAAREARRAGAFSQSSPDTAPSAAKGAAQKGMVQPPSRPGELSGAVNVPVQGLDEARAKVAEVSTSLEALGPVGQSAGSTMASGFSAGISQMEAELTAAVSRMQQKLASLKAPSLGFGGLNTGKGMGEVR